MKCCFKCLCEKPLEDFYKHAAMKDGRLGKCKECTKADVKKHRQDNWEAVREKERITLRDHQNIPHLNSTMGGRYKGKELQYRGRE